MKHPSPEIVNCPHCRTRNFAIDDACAECGKPLTVVITPRPKIRRVNLQTVMIVIAMLAVCLAPIRTSPAFSVFLMIFMVPPTIRGILMIEERKADNRPMDLEQKFVAFGNSCLVTMLISFCAFVAFGLTCFPIGLMSLDLSGGTSVGFIVACAAGAVAAIFVIIFLGRRLWPRKD